MPDNRYGSGARTPARPAPSQQQRRAGAEASGSVKVPSLSIERFLLTRRGNARVFAAVRIGKGDNSLVVDGCKIIEEPGKRAWAALPSQEREKLDPQTGELVKKYYPVVSVPDAWLAAIQKLLVDAWDEYQRTGAVAGVEVVGGARR